MIRILKNRYKTLLLSFFMLVFIGCAGHSPPADHYLLRPLEQPAETGDVPDKNKPLRIGIGPIEFPQYLNRPQMVFRKGDHEVKIAQFERWAEPLADNFSRVLMENLALLLNTDHVYAYPMKNKAKIDYQISINIYRFDATPGQIAELTANVSILGGEDRSLLFRKRLAVSKTINGETPSIIVATLNEILTDFSHEIASKIKVFAKTE